MKIMCGTTHIWVWEKERVRLTMANPRTGWKGSGSKRGSRSRKPGKGTVYWIDLDFELDCKFEEFALHHGMWKRDAAKALMAVAMGMLPPDFWSDAFTGQERTNLIRQIFPKGSGHTNRAPHAVWKGTYSSLPEMRGAPGGVDWIGLLVEREKDRLRQVTQGKRRLELTPNQQRKMFGGKWNREKVKIGEDENGEPIYEWDDGSIETSVEDELLEYKAKEEAAYAKEQLRILERERRLHLLERGIIEKPKDETDEIVTMANRVRRKKLPEDSPDLDPYERERRKNLGVAGVRQQMLEREDKILERGKRAKKQLRRIYEDVLELNEDED